MTKHTSTPEKYRAPLRNRKAIIAWITSGRGVGAQHERHSDFNTTYPIAFNVKLRGLNLSFDNLLKIHLKDSGDFGNGALQDVDYIDRLRVYFDAQDEDKRCEYAVEATCNNVVDYGHTTDPYKDLWDGTPMRAELCFFGRSGGWLGVEKLLGVNLTSRDFDLTEWLDGLDYADLRNVYRYLVMLGADFGGRNPEDEVEYHAADRFFEVDLDNADAPELPGACVAAGI